MWNQITLEVPDDLKDAVIGELSDSGVTGVWEDDASAPGSTRLTAYFTYRFNLADVERSIREVFGRGSYPEPSIFRSVVEECDWTEQWKKSYKSFPIADAFYVIPSWVDAPCPNDRLPIHIDPGQAFGTGTHETTQLTIEALERWVEPQFVVLDVGTGSGILALASRLLGASRVIACDIDPVAVQVAQANIERNHEGDVWSFCGSVDGVAGGSIGLLLGNLTADVIIKLFPEFERVLQPSGLAIFSGILNEQSEDIQNVCAHFGFLIHEKISRGEWLALVAAKHGA